MLKGIFGETSRKAFRSRKLKRHYDDAVFVGGKSAKFLENLQGFLINPAWAPRHRTPPLIAATPIPKERIFHASCARMWSIRSMSSFRPRLFLNSFGAFF